MDFGNPSIVKGRWRGFLVVDGIAVADTVELAGADARGDVARRSFPAALPPERQPRAFSQSLLPF